MPRRQIISLGWSAAGLVLLSGCSLLERRDAPSTFAPASTGAPVTAGAESARMVLPPDETPAQLPAARIPLPPGGAGRRSVADVIGVEANRNRNDLDAVSAFPIAWEMGAGFVRFNRVDWGVIEAARRTYDFSKTDNDLLWLASLGARPIIVVQGTPGWARPNTSYSITGPFPREYLSDYTSFWHMLVARYSRPPYGVRHWEIYNEPDNTSRTVEGPIGVFGDAPAEYALVLRAAYEAIKSVDREATVLFGGLGHDFFRDTLDADLALDRGGVFNRSFLDQVLALGVGLFFDGLAFHYYPEYDQRWTRKKPGLNPLAAKAEALRDTLRKYGLEKPLYNTELGYSSYHQLSFSSAVTAPPNDRLGEEAQANFLVRAFTRAFAADLESAIWYRLADSKADQMAKDFYSYHGLIGSDGKPKPASKAFQVAGQLLGSASYVGPLSAGELAASNVEGHRFQTELGKELWVLWATSDVIQPVVLPKGARVTVVERDGRARAATGDRVAVTANPIYVLGG